MKKLTLILLYLFASIALTAQAATSLVIDSTQIRNLAETAYNVGTVLNGGAEFIPGIPNNLLHILTLGLITFFIRHHEKKKLRKKGLLLDKTSS